MAKTRDALSVEQGHARKGLQVRRYFTSRGTHPYDELTWERRDAVITNWRDGTTAFEQRGLEFPNTWSQNATNIVAQKYFRGPLGTPQRESSVRQMVDRVAGTITRWGAKDGYFASDADAEAFQAELTHILVNQKAAFNSPVWFNVGVEPEPQCSACQPYDALVSTPTGMVPIGELVERQAVGTVVYDAHGETRVRAVKANGDKRVFRVLLRNGAFVEATADHLVYAVPERRTLGSWLRMDQLRPGMRLHLYPHRASSDDVVGRLGASLERVSQEGGGTATLVRAESSLREASEAALAGWLQADGFVGQDNTGTNISLTIEFQTATEEEYDWVQRHLQVVFPGVHQHVRAFKTQDARLVGRRVRLYGEVLRPFVESWGLLDRRHAMRVPTRLWNASNEAVAAYLRSVFQADGYVTVRGGSGHVAVAVISERWTEDLQVLLLRLGIYSRRLRKVDARSDRSDLFEVSISMRSERATFRSKVGFLSARKVATLDASLDLDGKTCPSLREEEIVGIEDRGVQPVFDIQTDSGEYLSNNIRVHNCFILSVDDTMPSILNWYVEEGMIFKGGSGSGVNLSTIRSSREPLGNGGEASGPVSFMRGADASAGTIKCLHRDTEIVTDAGVVPIVDVRPGSHVLTRHGFKRVKAVHDNGTRPLVRVRTALGDEILCTPEHRFRVRGADGETWRQAGRLRVDDHVMIDLGATQHGAPQPLTPVGPGHHNEIPHELPEVLDEAFALWLGWLYGDGSISTRAPAKFIAMQVGDGDPELVARYTALTKTIFGEQAHIFTDRHHDKADASASIRFCSSQVIRFLEANGLRKGKAAQLRVPELVKSAPASVRAAFLSGVFEADGHVGNGYPVVSTISEEFARDLHRLLLSVGIPSQVGVINDRAAAYGRNPVHTVRVVGGLGVRRFAKLVGFLSERKSRLLEAAIDRKARSPYELAWVLPHVGDELDRLWQRSTPALKRALAPYARYTSRRSVSLLRARALLDAYPRELAASSLSRFALGGEMYVPVTVEPAGQGPTFDLTVEDVHEYLVHNVVTHNSGGKTRRAAKMVILNVDHPDVRDFIWCKAREEHKARALRDAGFDMDLDGRDSISIQYQNANNSVRVTDDFMRAYEADADFDLRAVLDGRAIETVRARDLMRDIAQAAWECADPGMQYDTTINDWHTTPESGRINASNPCSEYMHLDNSACNLASLNLMRFLRDDEVFDVESYRHAIDIVFLAQEIIVGNSSYPTERIAKNAVDYRQLGIGYANLGALLMTQGLPYDSDGGRAWAGAITALLTGQSYRTSARVAQVVGPFAGYAKNREPMLGVIAKHRRAVDGIDAGLVQPDLLEAARQSWDDALQLGGEFGFRNAQASVLAPTGTISFLMDCDTTGIEPDLALVKTKKLVGGGSMSIVNQTVPRALRKLGYAEEHVQAIVEFIAENNSVKGAPALREEHYPVFDCAMGDAPIHYMGHIRMMASAQPFISGAISKCVTGETLVPTGDGLIRIGSLHEGEPGDTFRDEIIEVASLDGTQKTDAFYYGGVRPVREVILRSGHKVTGTPNHRLLVASPNGPEWRYLSEIRAGDYVAQQYGADLWSTLPASLNGFSPSPMYGSQKQVRIPSEMTEELAFLLGAFAAEGHLHRPTYTAIITNSVESVLERVSAAWRTELGVEARFIREPGKCPGVAVSSKTIVEFLDYLGCGGRAADKRIPDVVLRSPKQMVLSFLQGLALDAYVTTSAMAKWAICLDSPKLLDDLQAVLTNLGVVHGRVSKYNARYAKSYDEVYASGEQAQRLASLVPFCEPDKAARARHLADRTFAQSPMDVVPGISGPELYKAIPKGKSGRYGWSLRRNLTFLLDPRTRQVSRRTLERVAALPGVQIPQWAEMVLRDNLRFSPVTSVADVGEREVFDLSVPSNHAFVGNGIVNHNTANLPESATVEDVERVYVEGWKLGLKALAIYRDNCKVGQPLSADKKVATDTGAVAAVDHVPVRRRLPKSRPSTTTSFRVGDIEGYLTAGSYPDDGLGEIFVKVSKQGSTLSGVMDAFAIAVSVGLQYGVPLEALVAKFTNMIFEPNGMTDDPDVRIAQSLVDYLARRLAIDYLDTETRHALGIRTTAERTAALNGVDTTTPAAPPAQGTAEAPPAQPAAPKATPLPMLASELSFTPGTAAVDAPFCSTCGVRMRPAGSCFVCESCGTTSGCS